MHRNPKTRRPRTPAKYRLAPATFPHLKFSAYPLALVLIAVLSVTSCSQGSSNTKISILESSFPNDQPAQNALMKRWIHKFSHQHPNINVTWDTYASASDEQKTISTSLASGDGPTVYQLGSTFVPVAYGTHAFHRLSAKEWARVGGRTQFSDLALKLSGPSPSNGIAVPERILPYTLVYNKKMFKAAEITSPPKTWTEFIRDAKMLTDPGNKQWGTVVDFADPYDPWRLVWQLTRQKGGHFLSDSGQSATLTSPAVQDSLRFWLDWVTKYKIASPAGLSYKKADKGAAFASGKVGMLPLGSSQYLTQLESSPVKGDYAIAQMPAVPYGRSAVPANGDPVASSLAGQYLAIPKYATEAQREAALKWIKFELSPRQQLDIYKTYKYLPASSKTYSRYRAKFQTPIVKPYVKAAKASFPTPFVPAWGDMEVAFAGAMKQITGEIASGSLSKSDIHDALQHANRSTTTALKRS